MGKGVCKGLSSLGALQRSSKPRVWLFFARVEGLGFRVYG